MKIAAIIEKCSKVISRHSMTAVFISGFTNQTYEDLIQNMNAERQVLGHRTRVSIKPGDYVLLVNYDTRAAFGVTRALNTFEEMHPYDVLDIYKEHKYNKFQLRVMPIVMFPKPLPFSTLQKMVGGADNSYTNIYKKSQFGFQKAFLTTRDKVRIEEAHSTLQGLVATYI